MRGAYLAMMLTLGLAAHASAAESYSPAYQQCLNFSYGQQKELNTCVEKEVKLQKKQLKAAYKQYLSLNKLHQYNIKQQHALWENGLAQRCTRFNNSVLAKTKQEQCGLAMIVERRQYYTSRSFVAN
jgi:uncharacterized protein YecT (DUF1311 family)